MSNLLPWLFIVVSLACLVAGHEKFKKEDGVKASEATPIAISNSGEDVDGRAPACAIRCPGGIWCCNWSAPICAGRGYCCPRHKPNLWGSYCY